jgi:hypothetical protein
MITSWALLLNDFSKWKPQKYLWIDMRANVRLSKPMLFLGIMFEECFNQNKNEAYEER